MSGPWRPWIPFAIQSGCGTLSFLDSQLPASHRFVSGDPQSARGRAHDGESLPSRQSYPRGNILSSTPRPFSSRLGTSPIQFTLVAQMEPAARPRVWTGALECELPFIFCPARHRTKELPVGINRLWRGYKQGNARETTASRPPLPWDELRAHLPIYPEPR